MIRAILLSILTITTILSTTSYSQTIRSATIDQLVDSQELIKELEERKSVIDRKEIELNEREAQLKILEESIIVRENNILTIRENIDKKLDELEQKGNEEIDKLVKMYSSTKPKAAANILVNLDLPTTTAVFRKLRPDIAGKILNEMSKINADYASKLTKSLYPKNR